jgi:hypothetical protein
MLRLLFIQSFQYGINSGLNFKRKISILYEFKIDPK